MEGKVVIMAGLAVILALGVLAGCQPETVESPSPPVSPAESDSPSPSPQPSQEMGQALTPAELDELGQWFRDGHGEMFSAPFSSVDEIDVSIVIHDGDGGDNKPTADFTQEEREALAEIGVDLDAQLDGALGVRLTGAEINAWLDQLYGFTLLHDELQERVVDQSKTNGWGEWYYISANDTYYHFSNGTTNQIVDPFYGVRQVDGTVDVTCRDYHGAGTVYQVELLPVEDGYRFLSLAELPEDGAYGTRHDLDSEELDQLSQWLSQAGVCELFWDGFDRGQDADLSAMLYDGAGLEMGALTQAERDALGDGVHLDVTKVTTAQIQTLLAERLGVLDKDDRWIQYRLQDWLYLEDYDAYYLCHGDTMLMDITCRAGVRWGNGGLLLTCQGSEIEGTRTVLLFPNAEGGYWIAYIRAGSEDSGQVEPLSSEELTELSALLSQNGVCQLFWSGFTSVDDVDLSQLLYDGGGLEAQPLTQEERDLLTAQGADLNLDVVKVTTEQIQQVFWDRFRENLSEQVIRAKLSDWYYLAQYDAYYNCHGDTRMLPVTCMSGIRQDSGALRLTCRTQVDGTTIYLVEVIPTRLGHRFLSIQRTDHYDDPSVQTQDEQREPLTQAELAELAAWFQAHNTIFSLFDSVDEVDLAGFLYGGTDRVSPTRTFSQEDRDLLQDHGIDLDALLQEGMWGFKLTMEEIRDYLARILGVDRPKWVVREQLLRNTSTWSKWYYFDETKTARFITSASPKGRPIFRSAGRDTAGATASSA